MEVNMDSPQRLQRITSVEVAEYTKYVVLPMKLHLYVGSSSLLGRGIISVVKSHIRKKTHKYGIEIPNSAEHAHTIDQKNGYFGEMQSH